MDRHPALRTAFAWEGLKKPLQVVRQQVALPWQQYDWRDATPDEQKQRRSELLEADRREGFDLSRAPLMRLMLMQTADDSHEFAWSCHHLVLDGWCLSLIFKEVLDHYEAYCQGRSLQPPRPQPFRDYIAWLAKQDPAQADDFWRQKLAGFQTPVCLPVERWDQCAAAESEPPGDDPDFVGRELEPSAGGPCAQSRGFGECRAELSSESTASLRSLAAQERITLSTILEGAWALLLARYSGSGDVVYGTTVSGRPPGLLGVETMLGPFINNLPVRVKLTAADRVKPWLAGLHAQKVESQQFEHAPLQQIQGLSELPQGGRLFESLVVLENYPLDSQEFRQVGCLQIDNVHGSATADYPLALIAMPGTRLTLRLRYDVRRFEAAYARQLLSDLEGLLEALAADPTVQKTGPYLIGGWSSGGVIAFEVARQLEAQGETVAMLALFDAGVQGADEKVFDQNDFLPLMLMMFPGQSKEEIEALQQQSPEQQLAYFQQRAELAQLVVAGAAAGQAQHVFDVFQANVDAITRYRPQPYPGKITLFRASEHATPMHKDPYLGWGPWAGRGVEVHEVPGNHVTMFRAPTVRALAGRLNACLEQLELVRTEP
jgi:thioesterase domain-containing protein